MKRFLTCVFTYNRFGFLPNIIRSVEAFFPWGDRLVIDDGSSDPRVKEFLAQIKTRGWEVKVMDRVPGRTYGGFYKNMRFALEHALKSGYDYCSFLEDDQQLVWKKDDYPAYVENVFRVCPDAIQIQPLLARRLLSYAANTEFIESAKAYRADRGFNTTAIWNLDAVRKHPDFEFASSHGDDLPLNSAYWLKKGYRLYLQYDPTVAILPWVKSQSMNPSAADKAGLSDGEFLLKPLSEEAISYLRGRSPATPAYQEYFDLCPANGDRPIWHQQGQNMKRYYFLCRQLAEEEDRTGQSPGRVPVLNEWASTRIAPLASHLQWRPSSDDKQGFRLGNYVDGKLKKTLRRIREMFSISWRDYRGYLTLRGRLQRERQSLSFLPKRGLN